MAATKAITISKRACKIGPSINCRTEKHGDDEVPACDIPISGILLQTGEVNALVGPLFRESLFDTRSQGKAPAILHPGLAARKLTEKFEGAVTIVMGPNQNDIELDKVTLAGLKFEPLEGGLVAMSLTVQTSKDVPKFVHKLIARQNTEIDVEISIGDKVERAKSKQTELPMQGGGPKDGAGASTDPEQQHRDANAAQAAALNGAAAH
jgi:hypothetical protein